MKRLLILIVAVAALTGCATDPGRRSRVAQEESARLTAPTTPLSSYGTFELKPMEMAPEVANDSAKAAVAKDLEARMIGGANRFFAGAWAGESSIQMDLELSDAATGAVVARPRIVR